MNYTNTSSIYAIHSNTVRYTWTTYYVFVLLSSLLGDSTILIASVKYRAFRLHDFIIVLIQHIAVCDILVSLTNAFPMMVSLMYGEWVLGEMWCRVTPYPVYCTNSASIMLISAMTTSRLILLRTPRKQRCFTAERAHAMCAAIWVFSLGLPIMFLLVDKNDIGFDQRIYLCDYAFSSAIWRWLLPVMTSVVMYIPAILTGLSTVPLVLYLCKARRVARRSGGSRRWQGIMTAVLTAIVYSISILPYAVYRIIQSYFGPTSFIHTHFFRLAVSFLSLNTISNFYIYSMTVQSFRRFLSASFDRTPRSRTYVAAPTSGPPVSNIGNTRRVGWGNLYPIFDAFRAYLLKYLSFAHSVTL